MRALVTGAGGFIGSHLARFLKSGGYWVRGVDLKLAPYGPMPTDEFWQLDLRDYGNCRSAIRGIDEVYHLAADIGGIGYITANHANLATWNVTMDANMARAAADVGVGRFFYASTACVYPAFRQAEPNAPALREDEAIPAEPERGYGWEKLFIEHLLDCYAGDRGLPVRIARFHNAYGPMGTYDGGKEKAPAAIMRKVAAAADGDDLVLWGDGAQTRSFMFVDDCVEGIWRITQTDYDQPINLGSDELVTIDELAEIVCEVAGKTLRVRHDADKPEGVRGRNSDNRLARTVLGWAPDTPLRVGIGRTYPWIAARVAPGVDPAGVERGAAAPV